MIQIQILMPGKDPTRSSNYILNSDSFFLPPLSQQVNLHDYAEKLAKKAYILFAVRGKQDIGACYFYADDNSETAYITSFSVSPLFQRQGAGCLMLRTLKSWCIERKKKRIELEVYSQNHAAQKLYGSFGFIPQDIRGQKIKMVCPLEKPEN